MSYNFFFVPFNTAHTLHSNKRRICNDFSNYELDTQLFPEAELLRYHTTNKLIGCLLPYGPLLPLKFLNLVGIKNHSIIFFYTWTPIRLIHI